MGAAERTSPSILNNAALAAQVLLLMSVFICVAPQSAFAQSNKQKVTITGGIDPSGKLYNWTITNNYSKRIVFVSFPHYSASTFTAPFGWEVDCENLLNVGVANPQGDCEATAMDLSAGIPRSGSSKFEMQVPRAVARRPGKVLIRFADDTEYVVAGVELPQKESVGERYVPMIGMGGIFAIFLLVAWMRSRGKKSEEDPDSNVADSEQP